MNFAKSESGTAMIEFALFLPLMAFIFIGVADYTMVIQQAMQVSEAAAAGAAYGTMPGKSKDKTGMQNTAKVASPGVSGLIATATFYYSCTPGGAIVGNTAICPGNVTPLMFVQVTTSSTASPIFAYIGIPNSFSLNGQAIYQVPWTL